MIPFDAWRGAFRGEDCVVVGTGPSALLPPARMAYDLYWTIGCNRAVDFCKPALAVCFEPFVDRVWRHVRASPAMFVFSHLCKDRRDRQPHPRIVQVPSKNVLDWFHPDRECKEASVEAAMSPFWAAAIACWLGFERVGLLGVDLTEDRYPDAWRWCEWWADLDALLRSQGTTLVNLSPTSRLDCIQRGGLGPFTYRLKNPTYPEPRLA